MITEHQQMLLEMPFNTEEHDFVNGNVYIRKSAIRRRLNMVDQGWGLSPRQLITATDDLVVYQGGITVCGVTRHAVGTGIIIRTKTVGQDKKKVPLEDFELARSVAKAHKTADSDIIARAAVHFGIGEYLKGMPKGISDTGRLAQWLTTLNKPAAPSSMPAQSSPTPPAAPASSSASSSSTAPHWAADATEQKIVYDATGHYPGKVASKLGKTVNDFASSESLLAAWREYVKGSAGQPPATSRPTSATGQASSSSTPGNNR